MKGVLRACHRSWLAGHITASSPAAVALQKVRGSLQDMCDHAVIAHIATCVGVTHEQAARIASSNLFARFGSGSVEFEMPNGLSLGRLSTSCLCLDYRAVVIVDPDVAPEFFELHSQCAQLDREVNAIEAETKNYFSTVCRTYTQLRNTHNALYTALLNTYGINGASGNPLVPVSTGRIAELINSLAGDNNGT